MTAPTITTTAVHRTDPAHIAIAGDRTLHVLDVDGTEVKVFVTLGPGRAGYGMEVVGVADVDTASLVMGHVARDPLGKDFA